MKTYHFTCDTPPSECVVDAVAWAEDLPRSELDPLYEAIDPDVLDELFDSEGSITLSFTYEGYEVNVDGNGHLTLKETPEHVPNLLVLDEECPDYPDAGRAPLSVTFSGTPEIEPAADAAVIHVGHFCRGASTATSASPVRTEAIRNPAALDELGVTIGELLSEQESTLLCFDSVTELLEHVDLEHAFRFLHILTAQVASESAVAHYHLDPSDERTRRTMEPLFDGVVD